MKALGISINSLALELHVPVTRVSQIVNERRVDYRRQRIAFGAALRHERRFLDESSEGTRIGLDAPQILENDRETSPAANHRGVIRIPRHKMSLCALCAPFRCISARAFDAPVS
jgi:hypothetical protein